jgi:hypothetical protein
MAIPEFGITQPLRGEDRDSVGEAPGGVSPGPSLVSPSPFWAGAGYDPTGAAIAAFLRQPAQGATTGDQGSDAASTAGAGAGAPAQGTGQSTQSPDQVGGAPQGALYAQYVGGQWAYFDANGRLISGPVPNETNATDQITPEPGLVSPWDQRLADNGGGNTLPEDVTMTDVTEPSGQTVNMDVQGTPTWDVATVRSFETGTTTTTVTYTKIDGQLFMVQTITSGDKTLVISRPVPDGIVVPNVPNPTALPDTSGSLVEQPYNPYGVRRQTVPSSTRSLAEFEPFGTLPLPVQQQQPPLDRSFRSFEQRSGATSSLHWGSGQLGWAPVVPAGGPQGATPGSSANPLLPTVEVPATPAQKNTFIRTYAPIIIAEAAKQGISLEHAVWLVAQAAVEVHWGNNYFDDNLFNFQGEGTKGHVERVFTEFDRARRRLVSRRVLHAVYDDAADSVQGHLRVLATIYPAAYRALTRPRGVDVLDFAKSLSGYASVGANYEDALVPAHRDVVSLLVANMRQQVAAMRDEIEMFAESNSQAAATIFRWDLEAKIQNLEEGILVLQSSVRFTDSEKAAGKGKAPAKGSQK